MFSGIIFDFDGVIVDSHPVHMRAWKKFLESVGALVTENQLQFVMEGRKRDEILAYFLGNLTTAKLNEYAYRKDHIFLDEAADVRPIKGLLNFLEELERAHLSLAVASSGSRKRLDFLLRQLRLDRFFRSIVTGDDVEFGKPDPAIFLKTVKNLKIVPSKLLAFEDSVSGVCAARSAGMRCVGIAQADRSQALLNAGAQCVAPDFLSLSCAKVEEFFTPLSPNAMTSRTLTRPLP